MPNKKIPSPPNQMKAGERDPSFGTNGVVPIPVSRTKLQIHVLAPFPAGHIEQKFYAACGFSNLSGWLARLMEDGTMDESFGDSGYAPLPPFLTEHYWFEQFTASNIVFLESGNVIVSGSAWDREVGACLPAATCLTPDGMVVPSFGTYGFITYRFPLPTSADKTSTSQTAPNHTDIPSQESIQRPITFSSAPATRLDDDQLLLLSTVRDSTGQDLASYLYKITPDGALDPNFGYGGPVLVEDPYYVPGLLIRCQHFDVDSQGRIVVVGIGLTGGHNVGFILRYDASGTPDQTFGDRGIIRISNDAEMNGVKVVEDDKIINLITSFSPLSTLKVAEVQKLTQRGFFDPDFNGGTPAKIDLTPCSYVASSLAVDDGGRILVVGQATDSLTSAACASRLMPNGTMDQAYGINGTMTYDAFNNFGMCTIQSGVKILGIAQRPDNKNRLIRLVG